jgi:hypothetical protein
VNSSVFILITLIPTIAIQWWTASFVFTSFGTGNVSGNLQQPLYLPAWSSHQPNTISQATMLLLAW